MRVKSLVGISILVMASVLVGCDPQKLANDYFKSLGLNPLAVVRDDIKPGALIVKKGSTAVYADSIFSYATAAPQPTFSTEDLSTSTDFQAVLKAHEADRKVDASAALDFLKTVLPLNIGVDLGLTNNVTINAINATGHRLAAKVVRDFLRNNSSGLHDFLSQQENGSEAYVAYETYAADTLNIVAQSGTDVSTKVELPSEFKPLSSGNASFKYARTSKDTLVIKGDHPYVFAVRTAKIVYRNGAYVMQVTNFSSGNIKAVGGDEKYATAVNKDYAPLKLDTVRH